MYSYQSICSQIIQLFLNIKCIISRQCIAMKKKHFSPTVAYVAYANMGSVAYRCRCSRETRGGRFGFVVSISRFTFCCYCCCCVFSIFLVIVVIAAFPHPIGSFFLSFFSLEISPTRGPQRPRGAKQIVSFAEPSTQWANSDP